MKETDDEMNQEDARRNKRFVIIKKENEEGQVFVITTDEGRALRVFETDSGVNG